MDLQPAIPCRTTLVNRSIALYTFQIPSFCHDALEESKKTMRKRPADHVRTWKALGQTTKTRQTVLPTTLSYLENRYIFIL